MTAMFFVAISIAIIAASLVMLRLGGPLWTGLGWISIASGVIGIVGVFDLAEEYLGIATLISSILLLIWFLGVGVGLWWHLPTEEAHPA